MPGFGHDSVAWRVGVGSRDAVDPSMSKSLRRECKGTSGVDVPSQAVSRQVDQLDSAYICQ